MLRSVQPWPRESEPHRHYEKLKKKADEARALTGVKMLPKGCVVLMLFLSTVQSASLLERSYEYVMSLGKNVAPSVMSVFDCLADDDAWSCAKEKAGKLLDNWDEEVDKQRRIWQDAADAEARASGRSLNEMPSQIGKEVERSLNSLADIVQNGVARALGRNHEKTEDLKAAPSNNNEKKIKKMKPRPPTVHLLRPVTAPVKKQEEEGRGFNQGNFQSWVIGGKDLIDDGDSLSEHFSDNDNARSAFSGHEYEIEETDVDESVDDEAKNEWNDSKTGVGNFRKGRGLISEVWGIGEKALDALAEHVIENENVENGIQEKSSFEEQRGKKKKKKKAILKLLILGAVLKAKIGTLLQILSFKLQVKFFIIALIGLAINLARFWVELKNKHQQPQKQVIYYEHAQHQHHYEHEDEPGWGPWSRSIDPEELEVDAEIEAHNRPYRAQERIATARPLLTLS